MQFDDLQVFSALSGAMRYHSERARVLAENVANAETRGFVPSDIAGGDVGAALETGLRLTRTGSLSQTHPLHLTGSHSGGLRFDAELSPDSETTIDGNAVVVEEQMARVAETRMAYEMAVGLYNKTLSMLRMAVSKPSA